MIAPAVFESVVGAVVEFCAAREGFKINTLIKDEMTSSAHDHFSTHSQYDNIETGMVLLTDNLIHVNGQVPYLEQLLAAGSFVDSFFRPSNCTRNDESVNQPTCQTSSW